MKTLSLILSLLICTTLSVAAGRGGKANRPDKADGHGAKAKVPDHIFGDHEHRALAAFVLEQLHAGAEGAELSTAIHGKLARLRKAQRAKAQEQARKRAQERKKTGFWASLFGNDTKGKKGKSKAKSGKTAASGKGCGKASKHGLGDDELKGVGAFVAARHAEGLRGAALAGAIKGELNRRKAVRKRAQEAKRATKRHGKSKSHGKGH